MFYVKKGVLNLFDPDNQLVNRLSKRMGSFVGQHGMVLQNVKYNFTIQALTCAELVVLPKSTLFEVLEGFPENEDLIQLMITQPSLPWQNHEEMNQHSRANSNPQSLLSRSKSFFQSKRSLFGRSMPGSKSAPHTKFFVDEPQQKYFSPTNNSIAQVPFLRVHASTEFHQTHHDTARFSINYKTRCSHRSPILQKAISAASSLRSHEMLQYSLIY